MNRLEALRYSLCVVVAVLAVGAVLSYSTNGFTTFTYEAARRADVVESPVTLSNWQLEDGSGNLVGLHDFGDGLLLVDFIYTRCPTVCRALGSRYSQLQASIDSDPERSVTLLSVSIDPDFDTPGQLQNYRQRHGGQSGSWRVARPQDTSNLQQLKDDTGIRVIPDGWGGFAHSESVHVIQDGRLVGILDWDSDQLASLAGSSGLLMR